MDDGINTEKINMKEVPLMIIDQEVFKETTALNTAGLLNHIRRNAQEKGMLVNEAKTGLMCVSAARSFDARVIVDFNKKSVRGKDSLKILGVTLDRDFTFGTHVTEVGKKTKEKNLGVE